MCHAYTCIYNVHKRYCCTEEANLCPERYKFRIILVVEVIQNSHVFAVAQEPVDGRKVLTLGQLLVQSPEHLPGRAERKELQRSSLTNVYSIYQQQ